MKHYPNNVSGNFLKLRNSLISATGKAIGDYNMIEDGDTILVCMSGGKDSHAMLMILLALQERAPVNFKLIAMNLDQKQPGFPAHVLPEYLEKLGVEYRIVEADTYSIVKEKIPEGKTTCSLCSIIPCDLCGSQENLQRQKVKEMLNAWELEQPGRINNIFRAMANVEPSHLCDTDLYDFRNLSTAQLEDEDPLFGDIAQEPALSLASASENRIEFVRKVATVD